MKALKLPIALLLAIVMFSSCSTDSMNDELNSVSSDVVIPQSKGIEVEILNLINQHREDLGLNPLQPMELIKSQTYSHNDYMIEKNQVSHDYFYQRKNFLTSNTGASSVAENVAYGYPTAEAVVNAWLNSEGHRANIEGDYTHFEVSADTNEAGHLYYTNIFIKK
ncbi:MAG: CAP domain-containing protein [Flavobacteriaceae bacterium]|nr:CAP domain-containing protein [Mangrovimonas sp.]MCB0438968.1 CAP domain-containing protein [Mangrovimonas sp.]MCB0470439.1 CAP domain-containing protein [Flavobacteriaceae bacterium]HPF98242.1 CAP domain-containing protein [Mangrovimonas sp.]